MLLYFKLFCVDGNVGCTVLPVRIFHSKKLLFISVSLNLLTTILSFVRQLTVFLSSSCAQQCSALTIKNLAVNTAEALQYLYTAWYSYLYGSQRKLFFICFLLLTYYKLVLLYVYWWSSTRDQPMSTYGNYLDTASVPTWAHCLHGWQYRC